MLIFILIITIFFNSFAVFADFTLADGVILTGIYDSLRVCYVGIFLIVGALVFLASKPSW